MDEFMITIGLFYDHSCKNKDTPYYSLKAIFISICRYVASSFGYTVQIILIFWSTNLAELQSIPKYQKYFTMILRLRDSTCIMIYFISVLNPYNKLAFVFASK